jgi:type I restriction enzyme S subunit
MDVIKMDLGKVIESKLDRTKWEKWKFSDLVENIVEKVKPQESDLEHYIGLKHLDSGSLHIKRFGDTESLIGDKLKIYKNDIIFAKRNAYLKRVSIAPFDAVVSAHSMVLRPKSENVLPEFLPFFLLSEKFWERAIEISVGSLSPTINWKALAKQEFLLPPKDQQAKLAELLWAMVEVIESENEVLEKLNNSFLTNRKYFIENGVNQTSQSKKIKFGKICSDWQTEKLNNVCRLISGNAFKSTSFKDSGNYQVLRIGNITEEGINLAKSGVFVTEITTKEVKYLIPKGAIVLSLTGTNGKRDYGFPSLMDSHNQYLLNQRLVMLIADESFLLFEFLFLISKMELFQAKFFLNATGTANQANVSIADVSEIEIPIPSIQEQKLIVYKMNQIRIAIVNSKNQISSSKALQKSLINQVF